MRKLFRKLFPGGKSAADKLRAKQLREAQIMELEHQLAADYHQAMANMHRDTQKRLTAGVVSVSIVADFKALQADLNAELQQHVHTQTTTAA